MGGEQNDADRPNFHRLPGRGRARKGEVCLGKRQAHTLLIYPESLTGLFTSTQEGRIRASGHPREQQQESDVDLGPLLGLPVEGRAQLGPPCCPCVAVTKRWLCACARPQGQVRQMEASQPLLQGAPRVPTARTAGSEGQGLGGGPSRVPSRQQPPGLHTRPGFHRLHLPPSPW